VPGFVINRVETAGSASKDLDNYWGKKYCWNWLKIVSRDGFCSGVAPSDSVI
jgi:hypothetical protein